MPATLSPCKIALAEGRQLDELAAMVEQEGATAIRCPMVSILDTPDERPVVEWLNKSATGLFDYIVFFTGEGVRRLIAFAERNGLRENVVKAWADSKIVTRGPKPVRALQEIGLFPTITAVQPTTDGVIESLRNEELAEKNVGVQMYSETNPALMDFLQSVGAEVHATLPYVYAPAADADRVRDLITQTADGEIDVIVFTSSPQVDRLFDVAKEGQMSDRLSDGLRKTRVAAVGPVVADRLREFGVRIDVCPEKGFVMKNLVNQIKRELEND